MFNRRFPLKLLIRSVLARNVTPFWGRQPTARERQRLVALAGRFKENRAKLPELFVGFERVFSVMDVSSLEEVILAFDRHSGYSVKALPILDERIARIAEAGELLMLFTPDRLSRLKRALLEAGRG